MSERVQNNLQLLKQLKRVDSKKRNKILKTCSDDTISCLCECVYNLLQGNVPVTPRQLKTLSKHKRSLRTLASKKTTLKTRRRILQKGGFLPLIIGPLLGLLSTIVGGAINRALDKKK